MKTITIDADATTIILTRAFGDALAQHLPSGWQVGYNDTGDGLISPPDEGVAWFVFAPLPNGRMRISQNIGFDPMPSFTAQCPSRATARRIVDVLYPPVAQEVAQERQRQAEQAIVQKLCIAMLKQVASACEVASAEITTVYNTELTVTQGAWQARAYAKAGGLINLNLDPVTIEQAQAILRVLGL